MHWYQNLQCQNIFLFISKLKKNFWVIALKELFRSTKVVYGIMKCYIQERWVLSNSFCSYFYLLCMITYFIRKDYSWISSVGEAKKSILRCLHVIYGYLYSIFICSCIFYGINKMSWWWATEGIENYEGESNILYWWYIRKTIIYLLHRLIDFLHQYPKIP